MLGWIGGSINRRRLQVMSLCSIGEPGQAHVTLFVEDLGNGYWTCFGGNQSNSVKTSNFAKRFVAGVGGSRRSDVHDFPSWELRRRTLPPDARFQRCVAFVLQDEGGNDDDPNDPGGRTSRGRTNRLDAMATVPSWSAIGRIRGSAGPSRGDLSRLVLGRGRRRPTSRGRRLRNL